LAPDDQCVTVVGSAAEDQRQLSVTVDSFSSPVTVDPFGSPVTVDPFGSPVTVDPFGSPVTVDSFSAASARALRSSRSSARRPFQAAGERSEQHLECPAS
jgi:hypothetical protein